MSFSKILDILFTTEVPSGSFRPSYLPLYNSKLKGHRSAHLKNRICIQNVCVYFGYIVLLKNSRDREPCFHQLITVYQIFQTGGSFFKSSSQIGSTLAVLLSVRFPLSAR